MLKAKGQLEPASAPALSFAAHQSRDLLHHFPALLKLLYQTVYLTEIHACAFGNSALPAGIQD